MKRLHVISLFLVNCVASHSRIFGGDIAPPHAYPYQVGMWVFSGRYNLWCGGTLISDLWVLTAASCLTKATEVSLLFGAHNIYRDEYGRYEVNIDADDFILHDGFDSSSLVNDIALIRLPEYVNLSNTIQIVRLPSRYSDIASVGRIATATGWGTTEIGDISTLKYVNVPIVSDGVCMESFPELDVTAKICTSGVGRQGTCHGDSGGPLVVYENHTPILVGVASAGSHNCFLAMPSIFTRVSNYLDWIYSVSGVESDNYYGQDMYIM